MLINFALCANSQHRNLITSTVVARKHSPPLQSINALVKEGSSYAYHMCLQTFSLFDFNWNNIFNNRADDVSRSMRSLVRLKELSSWLSFAIMYMCVYIYVCVWLFKCARASEEYTAVAARLLRQSAVRHLLAAYLQRLVCVNVAVRRHHCCDGACWQRPFAPEIWSIFMFIAHDS